VADAYKPARFVFEKYANIKALFSRTVRKKLRSGTYTVHGTTIMVVILLLYV